MMNNIKKQLTKKQDSEFDAPCSCGSGELAGACCKSNEPCPCGSGKKAGECCYTAYEEEEE